MRIAEDPKKKLIYIYAHAKIQLIQWRHLAGL